MKYFGLKPIAADPLVSELNEEKILRYDAIVLLPNNTGQINNYNNEKFLRLLGIADDSGIVIAAWCRAVRILAKAGLLKGLQVVGHPDYAEEYKMAGGEYLGRDHEPVVENNIVTIVRSRYYRTAGCEAIKNAVEKCRIREGD